ncbi:hypothetical protein TBLA_0I01960 [Henningerozyma blattae CBS 6284]|uniref:RING-type domain-containing protein n=1 Tax=Henningerozyma blattae (strain ATCC 34711 / CBS 6284 / DSM 70876 / NBRC 10599 / NRRL Y-10934 / UCD 77-7) TaxID=1071380 RepID=I2H903_HENB6|nr:hypothetical protein TBLA_0I01960 [Tetrapisispora blattae CBS 6284]CCH62855.1 hypothetical protein TBLA_0I01960 [Tetrapisispora blattae CBS 6284]
MASYQDEHNISNITTSLPSTSSSNDSPDESQRTELRSQLQSLFQSFYHHGSNGESLSSQNNLILLQLLSQLMPESMQQEFFNDTTDHTQKKCSSSFIDSLERINKKSIKNKDEICSICRCKFFDDDYPLIIELPNCKHYFDLECITLWLQKNSSCPICRNDVLEKKFKIDDSQVELEEDWGMYG